MVFEANSHWPESCYIEFRKMMHMCKVKKVS